MNETFEQPPLSASGARIETGQGGNSISNVRNIVNVKVRVRDIFNDNVGVDISEKCAHAWLMFVVTFANPKGGSGKTTSAMLLAEQIALSGGRVAVLDLDPNANILGWFNARQAEGRSTPFGVHARPQAEDTVALIDSLDGSADYLIIDLEGSKDQIVTYALSRTDLCLIPMDGSPMEARQAAQAVRLIETTGSMIRTRIPYALLFTRTNAAFQTTDERDVRSEMAQNNISTLPVRIAKRAPYTRIFRDNVLLSEIPAIIEAEMDGRSASVIDKAIKQIASAIENAQDYAQTVIDHLTEAREA